jgi:anti-sigma regulatory factor (Ser/Thr protein kinase)
MDSAVLDDTRLDSSFVSQAVLEPGLIDRPDDLAVEEAGAWSDDALHSIRTVIEAPRLDPEELLPLLLDRVLELLRGDTAAVLLLDASANQLIARAARGLEEEVRQGVRIPMGVGFAGRVASERRPVTIDRVDATTVANPILWEKGIRSMLGVPLIAGGTLMGVLHVGSFTATAFDENEVMLLEVVADKIAAAVQAGIAASEHVAAGVLQRSLLPSALPKHPYIDFASRYAPAERGDVGGDWYDAFAVPAGDVWVMTGDVTGHGLNPAIIMGRLRSAMRAYALLGMSPEDVLRGANRKLQFFEPGAMATVICGVLSPPFREFRVCSAGHPAPVMVHAGEEARLLDISRTPPLGVLAEIDPLSSRWPVASDTVLVLYTDGLVERRGESIVDGLERLRAAVHSDEPERLCGRLMDSMIGGHVPDDDVALLALRIRPGEASGVPAHTRPTEPAIARSDMFPCDPRSARAARRFIAGCVESLGLHSLPDIQLMVSELATNAVLHSGAQFDVTVERVAPEAVRIEVRDFGHGFPELAGRDADAEGGRGLQTIDLLARSWGIERRPGGTGKTIWFVVTAPRPLSADSNQGASSADEGP